MSKISIKHLMDKPELLPTVALWIYKAFWTDKPGVTPKTLENRLSEAVTNNSIPLSLIAYYDDKPVGTVNLIESDDSERPLLRPWLAALFVKTEYRKKGIGAELVKSCLAHAHSLEVPHLFLGTDIPEFYQKYGATFHEQRSEALVIMKIPTKIA